jgi:hypothetical protein
MKKSERATWSGDVSAVQILSGSAIVRGEGLMNYLRIRVYPGPGSKSSAAYSLWVARGLIWLFSFLSSFFYVFFLFVYFFPFAFRIYISFPYFSIALLLYARFAEECSVILYNIL